MSPLKFDTIVIGSGTSAYYCITQLNAAGQRVAVIDSRPYGGTCALRGCQPKKYLVAAAEAIAASRHLVGKGISNAPKLDWAALQAHKNEFLEGRSEGEVKELQELGVTTYSGKARLVGNDEVEVNGERLKANTIVLATGASPTKANIQGSEHTHDSEYFLDMPELPKRILFIGGGYISFEFAHVAAQAGADVTILHRSSQPLKQFEPEIVDVVLAASQAEGIQVVTNESPEQILAIEGGYRVVGKTGAIYEVDLIIEATGRAPNLSALEDDLGNVLSSARGVTVNEFLQSVSNPQVYAIGDCANSGPMLATVADEDGKAAARNILTNNSSPVDYSTLPSAAFTIPELATVGLTEAQAKEAGLDYRINRGNTINWPSSKRIGESHGGYKVLIDKKSGTIIGAHLARHNAAEVINTFALAIKHKIQAEELADFLWAYPTYTSDLKYMVK